MVHERAIIGKLVSNGFVIQDMRSEDSKLFFKRNSTEISIPRPIHEFYDEEKLSLIERTLQAFEIDLYPLDLWLFSAD